MMRFNDPDDRNRPPEDLTAWLAAGLRRVEAQAWRKWNFTLTEAKHWRSVGVTEALTAAQWQVAGVQPDSVTDWTNAHITVAQAIRWHEFGFDFEQAREHTKNGRGPEDAYKPHHPTTALAGRAISAAAGSIGSRIQAFLNAGVPHTVMGSYLQTQWTDDQAIAWSQQGIQAWDARLWQQLGLTPAEAGELTKQGMAPGEVWTQWWRSGIPFDEAAEWIGAGLSVEEAVRQRESGVTVEQAAALRVLRRGGAI